MTCCPGGECEADSLCVTTADGARCRRCGSVEQPCCEGGVCARGLLCQFDGRCRADFCGRTFSRCCDGNDCELGSACVSLETASRLDGGATDAGDAGDDAEASDADVADATDAADASDADASDADASDVAGPNVCLPCGAQDQPCCAPRRCEGAFLVCDPAAPEGAPMCRLCGFVGSPCCPGARACRDGSRCVTRPGDVGRCVDEPDPPDAATDGR